MTKYCTKTRRMLTKGHFIWKISIFFVLMMLGFFRTDAQTTETFSSGSFIINMGVSPQTVNNGLRPYGMIYDLLKNNAVPIYWIINPTKVKDGADFTHNGVTYRGGAFIIPAEFRTTAVNSRISFWQSQGVVGATSVAPLTLPVNRVLTSAPRWTLDKDNGDIAAKYFVNASIPATAHGGSSSSGWKTPSQLGVCDDVFAMPHAEPTWGVHGNLLNWNSNFKGNIYLGCAAGGNTHGLFNPANRSQQLNFLAGKTGIATGGGPSDQNSLYLPDDKSRKQGNGQPYIYDYPTDPVMQFVGTLDGATIGGAQQIYMPLSPGWNSATRVGVYNAPNSFVTSSAAIHRAAAVVWGPAFGNTNNGQVLVIGGHDITRQGNTTEQIAAQRAFFNFSFAFGGNKTIIPSITGLSSTVVAPGEPISLSFTVPAPGNINDYTAQWSASCGGTFSPSATARSVTFTPSAVPGAVPCVISVVITDPCGRTSFESRSVTVQCSINVGTTITQPCIPNNNGSIALSVTNAPAPYTWTWTRSGGGSGSGSGTLISGLSAGTYNITVSAANGCATSFTRTLSNSPAISVTATPTAVLCNGGSTGTISTTVTGGTPGFTYLWAGGVTTPNRSGLVAGNYSVTVTDSRGCTGTASATITQPAVITGTPTITPVNCFGSATGAITLAVSGGTGPYTYLWNDGGTTQNRTGLAAGTYSVVITDSRGCTGTVSSLSVTQPAAALSLTSSVTNNVGCGATNGSATVTPAGGTSPYTYDWSGTPTGDGTPTITGLAAGTYSVTVTDARGCTALTSVTITETSPLVLSTQFTRPSCPPGTTQFSGAGYDGSISLTISGGRTPYNIVWTAPVASPQGLIQPAQVNSQNLTLLRAGTYSVTVTDANNCSKTTSVTLTNISPNPVTPPVIKINN